MIRWTTPTLKCTIPKDLPLTYLELKIEQNNKQVVKRVEATDINDGVFYVTFSQEETSSFVIGNAEVQLNIMNGDVRMATNIVPIHITKNLKDELMDEML